MIKLLLKMTTINELETAIKELEVDIFDQTQCLEYYYLDIVEDDDGIFYYNSYSGHSRQLTNTEVNEYRRDCNYYIEICDELQNLISIKHQMVECQQKMIKVLAKMKTYIEIKSFQKANILNDDVNSVIAGYLTGVSNNTIEKQLRLF
jgi:hypothetical protein